MRNKYAFEVQIDGDCSGVAFYARAIREAIEKKLGLHELYPSAQKLPRVLSMKSLSITPYDENVPLSIPPVVTVSVPFGVEVVIHKGATT